MYIWNLQKIDLEFKTNWVINGGAANQKTNTFVSVEYQDLKGTGEISASTKNDDIKEITSDLNKINFNTLQNIDHIYELNICPQVKAGIEMAWIHLQCQLENKNIHELFNLKFVNKTQTSFSIPILNELDTADYINKFKLNRFSSCKLKISGLSSVSSVLTLANHYDGSIRIDANESFANAQDVLEFLKLCKNVNLELLEQPLAKDNLSEAKLLKPKVNIPIIGDESITDNDVGPDYLNYFHGLNIKLMKAGGYRQAIKQLKQCRELGLKTMVGCMVETSLNISAALNISQDCDWVDLDGHLLLKNDPFDLLQEKDGVIYRSEV